MTDRSQSAELLGEFREEGRTQVERLEAILLEIEGGGGLSTAAGEGLLRALHTLKGNSAMLGLDAIRDAAHALEEVFRTPAAKWPREQLDLLFATAAALREMIDAAGAEGADQAAARLRALSDELARMEAGPGERGRAGVGERDPGGAESASAEGDPLPPEPSLEEDGDARADRPAAGQADAGEVLRVPFSRLNHLLNLVAELVAEGASLSELLARRRTELRQLGLLRDLEDRSQAVERLADALHDAATELRTVPISRVFARFPGLVREMARAAGKEARLLVEGGETELDKSTVDVLAEPLMHLVRNAVDHGVRTPEERRRAGKPEEATLVLRASRSGDRVLIELEDDGPGLNRAAIAQAARRAGLLGDDQEPEGEDIAEFIFRSGISTRETADQTSGRGVGLDVVRRTVARLRGALEVSDRPGGGTRFSLSLPLTLAVLPTLLFESEGETFALPAADVEGTAAGPRREWIGAAEVVRHEEEVVPLARPVQLFRLNAVPEAVGIPDPPRFALFLRRGTRQLAVAADRLIDQDQLLVRALPSALGQPTGVSGITATHAGHPVLLLDAGGLIELSIDAHRRTRTA